MTKPTEIEMDAARAWARRTIGYDPPWTDDEIAIWFDTTDGQNLRRKLQASPAEQVWDDATRKRDGA